MNLENSPKLLVPIVILVASAFVLSAVYKRSFIEFQTPELVHKHTNAEIYDYRGCMIHVFKRPDDLHESAITSGTCLVATVQSKKIEITLDSAKWIVDGLHRRSAKDRRNERVDDLGKALY